MSAPRRSRDSVGMTRSPHPPPAAPHLSDERSPARFRVQFGRELQTATGLATAVTGIRLDTLDLTATELRDPPHTRLLLREVRAARLDAEARALALRPDAADRLARLDAWVAADRVRIRAAPLGGWAPDFSVFHDAEGPRSVLLGNHAFGHGEVGDGPVFSALFGRTEAGRAAARFDEIWANGHDVTPALQAVLRRARRRGPVGR